MDDSKAFLSPEEEKAVVEAIQQAEKNTSGEIRVHLEKKTSIAPMDRAIEVFNQLEMFKTKDANGVLIYVATEDHKFAICGDKGINEVVPDDFWESTKDIIRSDFKKGNFKQGLIDGILEAGNVLKKYFPYCADDNDELSNEISKG
jgi:uncharacterized membrane protein